MTKGAGPEFEAGWSALHEHCKRCDVTGCGCHTYKEMYVEWSAKLPLTQANVGYGSWLWHTVRSGFCWICIACDQFCQVNVADRQAPRISNLTRHANSTRHKRAVMRLLNSNGNVVDGIAAPDLAIFTELFREVHSGTPISRGIELKSARLGEQKARALTNALAEAVHRQKMEAMRNACVAMLIRDERHKRLHFRFRCSGGAVTTSGYLGQSVTHTGDALGIAQATETVLRRFCSKNKGGQGHLEFDEGLYNHLRHIIEAISIDSASNEVCSATDLSWALQGEGILPNCRRILRDAAHSARRLLGRLMKADPVLNDMLGLFCHWRDSLAQIVHHSLDMRQLYEECIAKVDDSAVSSKFKNLRCAKHRIETFTTPMSRSILNLSGLMLFAMTLVEVKKGERAGAAAETFLLALSPTVILLAGMIADAASMTLELIRAMDTEDRSN